MFLVLFEHAVGYALFRCQDVEDTGSLLPEVQAAVTDFSRFSEMVSLESFSPFKNGTNALDNINSVSEGMVLPLFTSSIYVHAVKLQVIQLLKKVIV